MVRDCLRGGINIFVIKLNRMGRQKLNKEDKKHHLTLHINEALLDRLNEKTDEKRSQVIEKLLLEYLNKKTYKICKNLDSCFAVQLGECPNDMESCNGFEE
jgi:hypothetical protein